MPAAEIERRNSSGAAVLVWVGVGLAPSGAALLVVGSTGGLLRAGAVLAMAAVVLVGVGSALSRSGAGFAGGGGSALDDDEIEALREDVRADITYAAKATHRVLAERITALSETVEALRGQIDILRTHVERNHIAAPANPHGVVGVAGVPAGGREYARPAHTGTGVPGYGGAGHGGTGHGGAGHGGTGHGGTGHGGTGHGGTGHGGAGHGGAGHGGPGHGGGLLRHTETVHVTTRQTTVVDANAESGYGDSGYADRGGVYTGAAQVAPDIPKARRPEHSREVHLGERSAEIRSDESSSEMRLRDRWASMVQRTPDEPAAGPGRRRKRADDDGGEDYEYWSRLGQEITQPTSRGSARPALPSTGSGEPAPGWVARPAGRAVSGEPAPEWVARSPGRAAPDEDTERVSPDQRFRGTQYGRSVSSSTEYGRPGDGEPWQDGPSGRRSRHYPDDDRR